MAWNGSNQTSTPRGRDGSPRPGGSSPARRPFALIVLLALGAVALYCVFRTRPQPVAAPSESARPAAIAEVKPAVPQPKPRELTPEEKERLAHPGMVKSPVGVWQPTNRVWRWNSKKVHGVHTNRRVRAKGPVPYRNATEQLMYMTFARPLGSTPPPGLRIPRKDMENLVNILLDKNPPKETDSQMIVNGKDIIAEAKRQLTQFIRNGGNPQEFFDYYRNEMSKAYDRRRLAQKEILRIAHQEKDCELARQMQEKVNEEFAKEGIKPLRMRIEKDDD